MKKKSVEFKLKAEKQEFAIRKIANATDAYNYARMFYFDDINIYESSFIILLNSAGNTIGYAKISQGGVSNCIVDVRLVAKIAIDSLAHSVILVHNHPSGSTRPSSYDDSLTKQVNAGLELLNIKLRDHLIITEDDYYSYCDEGKL